MLIVCVKCKVKYVPVQVGVEIVEMFLDPQQPYKMSSADILHCPICLDRIAATDVRPHAEHFQEAFKDKLNAAIEEGLTVNAYEPWFIRRQKDDS